MYSLWYIVYNKQNNTFRFNINLNIEKKKAFSNPAEMYCQTEKGFEY